jgi:hypothetical protein
LIRLLVCKAFWAFNHFSPFEIVAHRDSVDLESLGNFMGRHAVLIKLDDLSSDSWGEFSRRLPYFSSREANAGFG